jgi:FtsP/CotA-like multicopper oxidase with cupredoxin domain
MTVREMAQSSADKREEQVRLLRQNGRDSIDSDEEELRWKESQRTSQPHEPRRRWMFLPILAILLISIFGLNVALRPTKIKYPATAAILRPEEDYILDPAWDFGAAPTTREYTWLIEDHELNPDGVWRPMVLINSTFPGPLLQCNEWDELVVHVHNRASNSTSIHWHGMYQNGTNFMDGTVGITQCPIAPGRSFTYRFNVTGQTGTYYYHSHMGMQASDGIVGPLVIHARGGKEKEMQEVPYEQDRVVLLSDHYYDLSSELLENYLAPGNENEEPVPPSALINGRNVRNCSDLPNRNCSSTGLSKALLDLYTKSSTRLRIINAGAFAEFTLQIDEHEFQVTEVDGTDVHPQSIHRLNINPAQRYSIVLTPPKENNKGLYWMRARMITHCFAYEEPELQEEVWGVVRYEKTKYDHNDKTKDLLPKTGDWSEIIEVECRDLNTSTLRPVEIITAPEASEHQVFLRSSFQIRDWALSRGYLNDSSFHINTTSPILHTLLDSVTAESVAKLPNGINTDLFNPQTQLVYQTTGTPTITVLIQNFDDGNHPFHLHGYKFFVLAQGHGYAPADLQDTVDLSNPLRRDTASVEAFGWLLIRFVADNPGVWAFHCHLGWHNEAGLGMVFATRVDEMVRWKEEGGMRDVRALCDG